MKLVQLHYITLINISYQLLVNNDFMSIHTYQHKLLMPVHTGFKQKIFTEDKCITIHDQILHNDFNQLFASDIYTVF